MVEIGVRSDEELIRQTLDGQLSAFEILVRRYQGMIFAYTRRLLKDHDAAEDATQEAFVRAFENLKKFDLERKFKPWLYRIAANYCKDFFKKENRWQKIHLDSPTEEEMHIETMICKQQENIVQKAVISLDKIYRLPIVGFYFLGLSYNDLAKLLAVGVNTVKTRLRRGRILLRRELINVC